MTASIKDLSGFPLDGPTGLNTLRTVVYKDVDSDTYHLDSDAPCAKNSSKDATGYIRSYTELLGTAINGMCPECSERSFLQVLDLDTNYLVGISATGLKFILDTYGEIYRLLREPGSMDSSQIFESVIQLVNPTCAPEFAGLADIELESSLIMDYLVWFRDAEKIFTEQIKQLRERVLETDSKPLDLFYARLALGFSVPQTIARPGVADSFKALVEAEAQLYASDKSIYLVNLADDPWTISNSIKVLHSYKDSQFVMISSAALDYLHVRGEDVVAEQFKLNNPPSEHVLEAMAALYDPNDYDSPFSTLQAAYEAAIKV